MARGSEGSVGGAGYAGSTLTIRELFAGMAMQGIVSSINSQANYLRLKDLANSEGLTVSQWIARDSFKQADAMIEERNK